jgi:CheY-like chemotaxis protein
MTPIANGHHKVLVVDDDPSVLSTYRRLIGRGGYRCTSIDDPRRVLAESDTYEDADLVLLDYKMPWMDGLTLLAELRRREMKAPCVLISAYLNDDVRHQARMLGVTRILDKPVDISRLRDTLSEMLPINGVRRAGVGA